MKKLFSKFKIIFISILFQVINANNMVAQNKAYVDKESNKVYVDQSKNEDHKILGYQNPDIKSKKLICISSFTSDVDNNPENLLLGAYYSTDDLKEDNSIYFISLTGDFAKLKFVDSQNIETPFYIEKKCIDLTGIKTIEEKPIISSTGNVVTCSQKENKNEAGGDPILVNTCLFKSYKTISTGTPDYKGRYSYQYELYKKINGKYVKVKNSALFNQNQNQLLTIINQKIQKDYKDFSSDPETKDCFEGKVVPKFSFEQLFIDFSEGKINFNVTFGLISACMSVDGTTISFTLEEIQQYLSE
jgi:hypothetical protein